MNEMTRIRDQMRRVVEGEAWHGPGVLDLVKDVPTEAAAAHPLPGAHSIWEILLHIASTQELVQRRLDGDATPLTPEENWPAVMDPSPAAWNAARDAFREGYRRMAASLETIDEAHLDDPVLPGYSSLYVTLHGLVQHHLYHGGQIGILRRTAGLASKE